MAKAAIGNKPFRLPECILYIGGAVHGQHGRKLFMGKFFGKLHALHFSDQDLGGLGYLHTGQTCDGRCFLAYDFGVEGAVDQDRLPDLFRLVRIQEVAAPVGKFLFDSIVHLIQYDDGLLGCTDHAVVKCL